MSVPGNRPSKPIRELVQHFRALNVHLMVPPGGEADELIQHLRRMGCSAASSWPPPRDMPMDVDVIFVSIRHLIEDQTPFNWYVEDPPSALIAIADYENPLMIEKILSLQAQSTIAMPLRTFGVLMDVLLSVANFKREEALRKQVTRLEDKARFSDRIESAKSILAQKHGVSHDEAYSFLRQIAMKRRSTISAIVDEIVPKEE